MAEIGCGFTNKFGEDKTLKNRSNGSEFSKPPVNRRGTPIQIDLGDKLFQRHCAKCHVNAGGSGIPDLRKMDKGGHNNFLDIVLNGVRADRGMGSFEGLLSAEEVEAIHTYLIALAWQAFENHHETPEPHTTTTVK